MKRIVVLSLFTLCLGITASFSQTRIITIENAIETALENNREIQIAQMNVRKASAAVREAIGYALPSVDVEGTFSHFLQKPKMPFPDFESLLSNATYSILFDEQVLPRDEDKFQPVATRLQSFAQTNNYESRIQITQTLFNSSVLRGIGASKIYSGLSKEELKRTISATILNVEKAFYGVLLIRMMSAITAASYENALENLRNVRAAHAQGLVSEFDLLQAEVRVENIRPLVLQAENSLANATNGLKLLLGIDQNETIDVEGELTYAFYEVEDEETLIGEALTGNYGLQALDLKMRVDKALIDLDRAQYWPTVYAFGNYTYAGSADTWDFQNYSSSIVGVTFSINLFRGLQSRNRVQQATITYRQTEKQLHQYRDLVAADVKSRVKEIRRVASILSAQERNVELAERAYDISVVRYREGTGSQLEIQNADIALQQARLNRLQSVYDYIIAKAELQEMLGRLNHKYAAYIQMN